MIALFMRNMGIVGLTLAASALSTPSVAHADTLFAVTPSGAAEEVFAFDGKQTIAKLSSHCIDARWTVISSSDAELVCEAPMNFGQSLVGQLLLGNSYSTSPRRFFRFNAAQVERLTRVQASGWMEVQMAFGQVRRTDFSGADFQNSILGFMAGAGGQFPIGTRFPNHALLGVKGETSGTGSSASWRITEVDANSPAASAGLVVGDLISKIAGRRVKDGDTVFSALAVAAKAPTYFVEVTREGKPVKLTVARSFRSPVAQVTTIVESAPPAPALVAPAASTADELAKFAKLRADGVITEAEFQAQKQKILAR